MNGAAVLARRSGKVEVPAESRSYVSAHSFWKRASTAMFDILIINLDVGSYLRMSQEKDVAMVKGKKRTCTFRIL